ncbi:MgtC/SapB family protein [Lactobacillaceae bacterium Melli_B4]
MMNGTLEWILRLFVAMFCGGLIGYERSRQLKSAGIRTHMVVAVGAALTTIVSKYGFYDLIAVHNVSIDPTRIAAQIVSGISFIGAGTILTTRNRVSGLTTAAGVWATAAIGMTEGAGLYLVGIIATIFIVAIQYILHDDSILNTLIPRIHIRLQIKADNNPSTLPKVKKILEKEQIKKIDMKVVAINNHDMLIQTDGVMDHHIKTSDIIVAVQHDQSIIEVSSVHE